MILVFQKPRRMSKTEEDWVQVQVLWTGVNLANIKYDAVKKNLKI